MASRGDDDNEELAAVERHEIEPLERRRVGGRCNGKSDLMRRPRHFLRDMGQHVPHGAGAAESGFDLSGRSCRGPAFGEQLIDVEPIALVRGHSPG